MSAPAEAPAWAREILERLARIEAALPGARPPAPAVMTSQEAARYVGFKSLSPLYAWARRWHVQQCGHGQWAKHSLDAGLKRQAERGKRTVRADDRRRKGEGGNGRIP